MTPAEKRRRATSVIHKLARLSKIAHWDIEVTFKYDEDNYGTCKCDSHYERASLNFTLEKIPDDRFDAYVCHEFAHILIEPLAQLAVDLSEGDRFRESQVTRVTETVTTTLERLLTELL